MSTKKDSRCKSPSGTERLAGTQPAGRPRKGGPLRRWLCHPKCSSATRNSGAPVPRGGEVRDPSRQRAEKPGMCGEGRGGEEIYSGLRDQGGGFAPASCWSWICLPPQMQILGGQVAMAQSQPGERFSGLLLEQGGGKEIPGISAGHRGPGQILLRLSGCNRSRARAAHPHSHLCALIFKGLFSLSLWLPTLQ